MTFDVIRSNIVNIAADAIVLPANEKLIEGSGASTAIFEAAGRDMLKKACEDIGHCDIGMAVPTPAYNLNAKYIIHAVVPKWRGGDNDEYAYLSSAYLSSMNIAEVMGCESIAFPLLASGNNGFNAELAFEIAKTSIEQFEGSKLKRIMLIVYDDGIECLIKSKGIDVTVIPELPVNQHEIKAGAKKFAKDAVKAAFDWLNDKNHQKKIIDLGLNIALIVITDKDDKANKAHKIIEAIGKIIK